MERTIFRGTQSKTTRDSSRQKKEVDNEITIDKVIREEITRSLKILENNKAPGIHQITSEMMKTDIEATAWLKKLHDKI